MSNYNPYASGFDEMNANPTQTGKLYLINFRDSILKDFCYPRYDADGSPLPTPGVVTQSELVSLWGHVTAHETGHMLGLVSHELLGGGGSGEILHHNQFPYNHELMDPGNRCSIFDKMGRDGVTWRVRTLNADYLRFILPVE